MPAAEASDLLPWVDDNTKAFCLYCLAIVSRSADSSKAASLARQSMDVCRDVHQALCGMCPPERIRRDSIKFYCLGSKPPPRMGVKAIHANDQTSHNGTAGSLLWL